MAAKAIRALRAFRGHAKNLAQTAKSGNIKITKSLAKIARELSSFYPGALKIKQLRASLKLLNSIFCKPFGAFYMTELRRIGY
jgi:hypothetical protein